MLEEGLPDFLPVEEWRHPQSYRASPCESPVVEEEVEVGVVWDDVPEPVSLVDRGPLQVVRGSPTDPEIVSDGLGSSVLRDEVPPHL